jgi:hypothetical protein
MTVGLFLISSATLLFEVVLMRLFSVALWGHYAFLVVSLSLLGFGASGSALHLSKRLAGVWRFLPLLFLASCLAVYLFITRIPFDPVRIASDPRQFFWLSLFYLFGSLPFFFSGLFIGSCFLRIPAKTPRLYAVNLLGSAVGSLLSLLFLNHVPLDAVRISPYKSLPQALLFPNSRLLETRWSAEGRVDIIESGAVRFAPGLSLNFSGDLPPQKGITIDGDRLNAVTTAGGEFLDYLPSSAPYSLLSQPEVLVIEAGGGLNILEALFHEAASVDAVERNDDVAEFADDVYSHPKVKRISSHARRHLGRSRKPYDLIAFSLADSPGAASTGLYGLNENYLYTVEAFRECLDHLKPEGILAVTRYLLPPPREEPRMIRLAARALEAAGVPLPSYHMAVIESYGTWTLLVKKSPLTVAEEKSLEHFSREKGFSLFTGERLAPLLPQDALFDLSPPTDDRPFFFHFFRLSKIRETYRSLRGRWEAFFEGGYLVYFALAQAIFWGILLIAAPVVIRRHPVRASASGGPLRVCAYFFCIGLAFMFIEMAFLQKAVFLFGNPIYGFAILLAALLCLSGIGSLSAGTVRGRVVFVAVLSWIVLSLLLKTPLLSALCGIPLFFFMGFPFPLALSRIDPKTIPLAWAANGVASVIGAILAVAIALEWGYSGTLMGAGILYLLAALFLPPF